MADWGKCWDNYLNASSSETEGDRSCLEIQKWHSVHSGAILGEPKENSYSSWQIVLYKIVCVTCYKHWIVEACMKENVKSCLWCSNLPFISGFMSSFLYWKLSTDNSRFFVQLSVKSSWKLGGVSKEVLCVWEGCSPSCLMMNPGLKYFRVK